MEHCIILLLIVCLALYAFVFITSFRAIWGAFSRDYEPTIKNRHLIIVNAILASLAIAGFIVAPYLIKDNYISDIIKDINGIFLSPALFTIIGLALSSLLTFQQYAYQHPLSTESKNNIEIAENIDAIGTSFKETATVYDSELRFMLIMASSHYKTGSRISRSDFNSFSSARSGYGTAAKNLEYVFTSYKWESVRIYMEKEFGNLLAEATKGVDHFYSDTPIYLRPQIYDIDKGLIEASDAEIDETQARKYDDLRTHMEPIPVYIDVIWNLTKQLAISVKKGKTIPSPTESDLKSFMNGHSNNINTELRKRIDEWAEKH